MEISLQQMVVRNRRSTAMAQGRPVRQLRPRRLRPSRPSRQAEAQYRRQLLAITGRLKSLTNARLLPVLKQYESDYVRVSDGLFADITSGATYMAIERMIASIAAEVASGIGQAAEIIAAQLVSAVDHQNTDTLQSSIQQAYGIDITQLLRAQNIQPTLALAQHVNVNLIKSVPAQYFERLNSTVLTGIQQGQRYSEIADSIQDIYGVTDSRAKLIARDQTSKTNAAIAETRQTDLGIEEYTWLTAGDERVRQTHADNDGLVFRWDSPPAETGHPGHDINCRCVAIPMIGSSSDDGDDS
jgi:SPP1 gp7 family putative phage head morphogenesis protein